MTQPRVTHDVRIDLSRIFACDFDRGSLLRYNAVIRVLPRRALHGLGYPWGSMDRHGLGWIWVKKNQNTAVWFGFGLRNESPVHVYG